MKINLSTEINSKNRKREVRKMKIYWAVYHEFFISKNDPEIAAAINISERTLRQWRKCYASVFENAALFWNQNSVGNFSLCKAENIWGEMTRRSLDLFPSENAIDELIRDFGLNTEASTAENQIPATPPATPRRFFWIHDAVAAVFAIGMLIG